MNCKTKSFMTKKKAFTLIELLIVIAIIGILFIVLVSKVDFATDKAKATGVQTDFRSFQVAFDTVAKENAGFNTFGWDAGDTNGDRVRNSYDAGDANQDGIQQDGEVWTGHKVYAENWTGVYTLVKPGTDFSTVGYDKDVIFALESAINKNLDPKLHITIDAKTGQITMANQAQDPWKVEYHGYYITNAAVDNKDRGAIIIYSNGANQEWGSEHSIANGIVTITVPGNNIQGKDDYSITSVYTYMNGYGEVKNMTTGFSNNQTIVGGSGNNLGGGAVVTPPTPIDYEITEGANETFVKDATTLSFRSDADYDKFVEVKVDGNVVDPSNYTVTEGSTIVTFKKEFFDSLDEGEHVVEIISNDGTASASFNIMNGVPAENPSGTIDSYSWSQIKSLAQLKLSAAEYKSKYGIQVGQKKDNKYVLLDMTQAEYPGFVFAYDTKISSNINSTNTNAGGYAASEAAVKIENLYNELSDEELKNAIALVKVKCNNNTSNPYDIALHDYHMFAPSSSEFGLGSDLYAYCIMGAKFTYSPVNVSTSTLMTRTCVSSNDTNFFVVLPSRNKTDSYGASSSRYIVACFVIGEQSNTYTPITYSIIGKSNKFVQDGSQVLEFCSNASYSSFVEVKIDGVVVNTNAYSISNNFEYTASTGFDNYNGVTHVIFTNDYLNSLSSGAHMIEIISDNGKASTDFTITAKTINSYSWSEIKSLANLKLSAEEYESQYGIVVGDAKTDNGIKYVLVDLGLDAGDYNGFVFAFDTGKQSSMNNTDNSVGGYANTKVPAILEEVYEGLATTNRDLYNSILKVPVVYSDSASHDWEYNMCELNCALFLPSVKEVGGRLDDLAHLEEGNRFDTWKLSDIYSGWNEAWSRSIFSDSGSFYTVRGNGYGASQKYELIACFVIGGNIGVHGGGSN